MSHLFSNMRRPLFLLPLIIISCATGGVGLRPSPNLVSDYKNAEELLAAGKKEESCLKFKKLADDKSFPLHQLALIQTLKTCPYTILEARKVWDDQLKNVHPAWKKDFLLTSMDLAKKNKLNSHYVDFSLEYLSFLETRKERENYLKNLLKETDNNLQVKQAYYELSPRFIEKPTKEEWSKVGYDFSLNRDFANARKYFNKVIKEKSLPPSERLQAYKRKAFSFKLERDKKRYSWQLEKAIKWFEKQKGWLKDSELRNKYFNLRIQAARAQWTVNYRTRAEKNLKATLNHPLVDSATSANAYFILGKIEAEKRKLEKAQAYYQKGLAQENINESTLEHLTWNLGWSYYLSNKLDRALEVFNQNLERSTDKSFQRKLTFWIAKTLRRKDQTKEANTIFEKLTEEDPFGFYGISSAMVLNKPLELEARKSYQKTLSPYPILNWLITLNKYDEAKDFLKDLQKKIDSPEEIEASLPLYHFAHWYEGGIFKFFKLTQEKREEVEEEHLPAAYPLPHQEVILAEENRSRLPAAFIYSIARQESAFNPKVRSWADAFGLLQVTPEKARSLASKLDVPYSDYSDLYNVKTNVTLGGELLKKLARRYEGKFIPTVAAYNAGDKPVRSWLKNRYREDPFEFIEMIPYKETRNYIKLVLRNYATYSRLLNNKWQKNENFFSQQFFM